MIRDHEFNPERIFIGGKEPVVMIPVQSKNSLYCGSEKKDPKIRGKNGIHEYSPDEIKKNYPVYLFYIPRGFDESFDKNLKSLLSTLGTNMMDSLYVAEINIGSTKFPEYVKEFDITTLPSIILSDEEIPNKDSLKIIIDEHALIHDIEALKDLIPRLILQLMKKDFVNAIKSATDAEKMKDIIEKGSFIVKFLSNIKVSFSFKGITIESK